TARKLVDMAKDLKTGIHVHVSETEAEHKDAIQRHGTTPMAFLDKIGATDVPLSAAHCVHVSDDDIALMAEKSISVMSCPQSNLKLGSGIAPIKKMMDAGVNVAVATDGSSSNNNLDMIEETMLLSLLQRGITRDAGAVADMQALKMATCGGAKALNKSKEIGQIKKGFLADIIMIDTSSIAFTPANDWVSCILNSGSGRDVIMTMIGGEIVFENGKINFADETETKERVSEFAKEICV
ncbi:MAG: amidohydrolase family protein, partial [Eubacteriales bacterium]